MAVKGASVAYCAAGGLVLFSGIKGATIADSVKALLSGNLSVSNTEPITGAASTTAAVSTGASGQAAAMLAFMESQNGKPYTEQNPQRFGPNEWDCSGLVYGAAKSAGVGLPQSAAIADLEAIWFKAQGWTLVTSAAKTQAGDLCFFTGASPDANNEFPPIGHVGMCSTAGTTLISAYDTASGVCYTPLSGSGGWVVGLRAPASASGSTGSTGSFAAAVLSGLGAPQTAANLASMNGWFGREGTKAQNNPMATTESEPGATQFNSAGVKNYPTQAIGVAATVATLNNGDYPAIVMALRAGQGLAAGNGQVQQELSTWSGGGYDSV